MNIGVSKGQTPGGEPVSVSSRRRKREYLSGVKPALKRARSSGIIASDAEAAGGHYLPSVGPDIEGASHDVDVGGGIPLGAGMRGEGIAEAYVNAGDFLILKNIANLILE